MAWTQAARDAAAMARKIHAGERKKVSYGGITPAVGFADKDVRARIAATLKAARSGKPGEHNVYKVAAQNAVLSTVTRNAHKRWAAQSLSPVKIAGVTRGSNKSTVTSAARRTRADHQFSSDIGGSSSNYRR